jgi:hypothetical protein
LAPADGALTSSVSPLLDLRNMLAPIYISYPRALTAIQKTKAIAATHWLLLRSLISSSHCSCSHHGRTSAFFASKVGTTSSQLVTTLSLESKTSEARTSSADWMSSRYLRTVLAMSERGKDSLWLSYRRTARVELAAMSLGPSSSRRGTPWGGCQHVRGSLRFRWECQSWMSNSHAAPSR